MKQCYLLEMNTCYQYIQSRNKLKTKMCKNTLSRDFTSLFFGAVPKTVHCHYPWIFWKSLPEILWRARLLWIVANFKRGKKKRQKTNSSRFNIIVYMTASRMSNPRGYCSNPECSLHTSSIRRNAAFPMSRRMHLNHLGLDIWEEQEKDRGCRVFI